MIVLKVQKNIEKSINGVVTSEWVTDTLTVSVTPDFITMKQWSDFWLNRSNLPEWFKEFEGKPEQLQDFDDSKTGEYIRCVAELVACFCDKPNLLRSLPFESSKDNSIIALYARIIQSIYTYVPKLRESFEYNGSRFVFPKSVTDSFGRAWVGAELTTGEAIEALQNAHVLNVKNEFGEYVLNDRKYHTDIALLASLARKVDKDGIIEQLPIETTALRQFYEQRIAFFKNAPMDIALDMAFFLSSSKVRSENIPIYQSLINLLQRPWTKGNGKKGTNING